MIDHLDYLKTLGVTALWISPVVRNLETDADFDGYHGYWQQDFEHVNPHFGDLAKLRELVQKAHAQGLQGDPRHRHEPRGAALLLRHQRQRPSRRERVRRGLRRAGAGRSACRARSGAVITHLTEYDPDFDPQRRARLHLARLLRAGADRAGSTSRASTARRRCRAPAPGRSVAAVRLSARRLVSPQGAHHRLHGARAGAHRRFPRRAQGPRDRARRRARGADGGVRASWIQAADFDGFRIDTLKHVEHEFWQYFAPRIRQYAAGKITLPDPTDPNDPGKIVPALSVPKQKFFMFGESFDGNDELNGSYTMNQEVDATFYFSQKFTRLRRRVQERQRPTKAIDDQFDAQAEELRAPSRNDDGIGVPATQALVNFMDNHDVTRFLFDKPSLPALHNALAFLFTEDGIPCLYYGTEQEFNGGFVLKSCAAPVQDYSIRSNLDRSGLYYDVRYVCPLSQEGRARRMYRKQSGEIVLPQAFARDGKRSA